jgi:intracellular sulfur oxidation DsrE/DsrF family protein
MVPAMVIAIETAHGAGIAYNRQYSSSGVSLTGGIMRTAAFSLTTILVLASGSFGPATADSARPLLVPGYEAAKDLPGARELPDPKVDYKVVFADGQDAKNPGDVNPMLPTIATYVNTLGKYGVPAEHRHMVIMFHQRTPDIDIVMSNEAYKQRYQRDNPNIAMIHALKQAGVDIRVCGQGLIGRKIEASQVNPDVQIDLWAMTTLVNLQLKGYVRVG